MQIELLNRQSWKTVVELSHAMAEWIEGFYNPLRRHSALGYLTPNEYEALHSKEPQAAFSQNAVHPTGSTASGRAVGI